MALLINQQGLLLSDPWRLIFNREALDDIDHSARQHLLLALPLWMSHGEAVAECGHAVGVWLGPDDEPEALADATEDVPVIAIQFHIFTDGRGYSQGRVLRERMGYTGDIRAMGDILRDQIYLLHKCGFSSFALRADQSPEEAVAALKDYSWSPVIGRSSA